MMWGSRTSRMWAHILNSSCSDRSDRSDRSGRIRNSKLDSVRSKFNFNYAFQCDHYRYTLTMNMTMNIAS